MNVDSFGIAGIAIDFAFMLFVTGGALIGFLYFWFNGRLDMDEEPKHQMMKDDTHEG